MNNPPSFVAALLAGFALGFLLGVMFGLWLGRTIGYKPTVMKYLFACFLVVASGTSSFMGWHYWVSAKWPTRSGLRPPIGAEYAELLRNCWAVSFAVAGTLTTSLMSGSSLGKKQRVLEDHKTSLEVLNESLHSQVRTYKRRSWVCEYPGCTTRLGIFGDYRCGKHSRPPYA